MMHKSVMQHGLVVACFERHMSKSALQVINIVCGAHFTYAAFKTAFFLLTLQFMVQAWQQLPDDFTYVSELYCVVLCTLLTGQHCHFTSSSGTDGLLCACMYACLGVCYIPSHMSSH